MVELLREQRSPFKPDRRQDIDRTASCEALDKRATVLELANGQRGRAIIMARAPCYPAVPRGVPNALQPI